MRQHNCSCQGPFRTFWPHDIGFVACSTFPHDIGFCYFDYSFTSPMSLAPSIYFIYQIPSLNSQFLAFAWVVRHWESAAAIHAWLFQRVMQGQGDSRDMWKKYLVRRVLPRSQGRHSTVMLLTSLYRKQGLTKVFDVETHRPEKEPRSLKRTLGYGNGFSTWTSSGLQCLCCWWYFMKPWDSLLTSKDMHWDQQSDVSTGNRPFPCFISWSIPIIWWIGVIWRVPAPRKHLAPLAEVCFWHHWVDPELTRKRWCVFLICALHSAGF